MVYLTLFIVAFLSGSLLPLGSEALFVYDINAGFNIYLILLFASVGNTLGAVLNYYLGLKGEKFLIKKGYLKDASLERAKSRFNKFGAIALLFSSLPIIGDPLTFVAGILEYNFKKFLLLVAISKTLRYLLLIILLKF